MSIEQDAKRYQHLCSAITLPAEFFYLLTLGASKEILDPVIDKDMKGNYIESLD
jgi:hypothetical protein